MPHWENCLGAAACLMACAISAAAQSGAQPMVFGQTRYELRKGEPMQITAPDETLGFLRTARSRSVTMNGSPVKGLVVGPDQTGGVVLAASLRTKPGEYHVTVSATSSAGETRQATMDVVVAALTPVPSGASRPPVVLLNGWENGITGGCPIANSSAVTFGNLAQYLVSDSVPVVYLFDNCLEDPNQTVEQLGNDLGDFLNSIQYDNGTQVPQIDLVAFSMGGLIARAYLAGLQPNGTLAPPFPTLVHKMVMIATPNFGSFLAQDYYNTILQGSQSAELLPGSALLWNLATWNQHADDLRGVPAVAVIGNAGVFMPDLTSGISLANASDGVVSTISASMGFVYGQTVSARIVPYCHVDPSAFTNTTFGAMPCNAAGIANVTSTGHLTGQIVRSYLSGTSSWSSIGSSPANDAYLSTDGGLYFALLNSPGAYVQDLSAVEWGTVPMTAGGDISTIYFQDFVRGTGTLQASSASQGSVNCGSFSAPVGFFATARCKENTTVLSVTPLMTSSPRVVTAGGNITINGASFSSTCNGCKVVATPAGSNTGTTLQVSSWTNTAITAALPASMTGLLTITVNAVPGTDSIAVVAAAANPSTIAAAPASLQFSSTGGAAPPAQSIQITNSGSGTLAWTATSDQSWLSVSPASGTAPSTLAVSASPSGLSAGSYNGTVKIAASGASNTPLSVAVTLTVSALQPSLSVSPQALSFSYAVGGAAPAAQTVAITNGGGGSLAWTATAANSWVAAAPASGSAPGTLSVTVNPANMAAGTYNSTVQIAASGAAGSPASVAITLVVTGTQAAPTLTAVSNAGSFQPGGASATWLSIFGTNLSAVTYSWQNSDFVNGALPASLMGVTVTIDGQPGYISYLSSTQINVLAPDDTATGPVQVQVTTAGQASNMLTLQKAAFAPSLFTIDNGAYAAALHLDYTLVGSVGLLPGVTSRPAQAGETIVLYGTGFGPANPALPTGQLITTPSVLANTATVTIGGASAPVTYAGLVSPGLYQLNVTVPSLPSGDAPIVATVGGVSSQTGVAVTIQ